MWRNVWTIWASYMAIGLAYFLTFEGIALAKSGTGDTLSEQVWALREAKSWWFWLIIDVVYLSALTFIWLIFHFKWQSGR